jgi:alpha-glucosidase (family GH31 glycosyl hydrolase)
LKEKEFGDLPKFITTLHENHYKFVPIVDIGFPINEKDEYFIMGRDTNAFIISNYTDDILNSFVWPGRAAFPDFFTQQAQDLWSYAMEKYYNTIKYDGIWLDMNEPAMTMTMKSDRGEYLPSGYKFDPEKNYYEYIPYVPGYRFGYATIAGRSLSENCRSQLYSENKLLVGYNFKPLMSFLENKATYENIVRLQNKRPFILSRSSTLGHGRYAFHWLGDNNSNYNDMRNGLNGIFQFQIFGITMTGDDICGFTGISNDTLCARWMTLGAFFPFSRNHNSIGCKGNEPYYFGKNSYTLKSSKLALNMRYSLLRYYYTQIFRISLGEKGSLFKPAFFNYFADASAYSHVDESFMLGDSFIIYPVFRDETDDIEVYLPKDDWNSFPDGKQIRDKKDEGGPLTLSGEFAIVNIFMRGGTIFPYQNTYNKYIANSYYLQKERTELFIIPDSEAHLASGEIVFDNDAIDTIKTKNYYYIKFEFIYNTLYFENRNEMITEYNNEDMYLSKLKFFRIKYLFEEEKCNKVKFVLRNENVIKIDLVNVVDEKFELDVSSYNLRFNEIERIEFYTE